jgi:hypothetical protein
LSADDFWKLNPIKAWKQQSNLSTATADRSSWKACSSMTNVT